MLNRRDRNVMTPREIAAYKAYHAMTAEHVMINRQLKKGLVSPEWALRELTTYVNNYNDLASSKQIKYIPRLLFIGDQPTISLNILNEVAENENFTECDTARSFTSTSAHTTQQIIKSIYSRRGKSKIKTARP